MTAGHRWTDQDRVPEDYAYVSTERARETARTLLQECERCLKLHRQLVQDNAAKGGRYAIEIRNVWDKACKLLKAVNRTDLDYCSGMFPETERVMDLLTKPRSEPT